MRNVNEPVVEVIGMILHLDCFFYIEAKGNSDIAYWMNVENVSE